MRASKQHWLSLCAVLTALALFAPAVLDALALWQGSHGHEHGHSADGTEWVYRSSDHARHDALQLEAAFMVRHTDCGQCACRVRSLDPLLLAPQAGVRHETDVAAVSPASRRVSTLASRQSQPRAPPVV